MSEYLLMYSIKLFDLGTSTPVGDGSSNRSSSDNSALQPACGNVAEPMGVCLVLDKFSVTAEVNQVNQPKT